ncbi:citrate synthase [Candidatus Venteria ishoeyi]|uniref:Citrate synthase n=1 Tax=Candidatus Venteria ishoeyi TaxID=1899563 RepID=A0A1H6FCK2_9GAMM|nr:citrate synthase [Candidatus Venteria ishoeyi]MDM8545453.1 citrate synthase [Candidatus Venteria ishoeyi]SEH06745.1 Citrate synthase [Candidatus Venteria ishoeyi]
MMSRTVTITDNATGKTLECPVLEGTHGQPVIDSRALSTELGMFNYDPAYVTTASCTSKITFIDGEKGILLYRGYPIEQLAENSSYIEVCYLLLNGELPTPEQFTTFQKSLCNVSLLHEGLVNFYNGFRRDSHPMGMMVGVVGALSSYYHKELDIEDPAHRDLCALRLIGKIPAIAARTLRYKMGRYYVHPSYKYSYVENFYHMLFHLPNRKLNMSPVAIKALEIMLILHADHEQNASTSTVRLAGSSQANPYACVAAGIATLWGPAHGGANEAVIKMLYEIGDVKNVPGYIEKVKDKNNHTRLMGFGHRVYKNFDPRATIIRNICHQLLQELDNPELKPIFEIAMELERIALEDEYFIERKLYPNVDFYSGIILSSLGIPTEMFTVLFAVARTAGWIAQWKEMMEEPNMRIGRPRQLYTGAAQRDYVAMDQR